MDNNKPNWLEALEKQSWQTELIASGLAIYGSMSIEKIIDEAVVVSSTLLPDRVLDSLVWVFMYFYVVQTILVFAFVFHLILRIVWAGIIGLSSAYPEGINLENKTYPFHFLKRAKEEFLSLSDYSLEIDKICSRVFANLCFIIFMFVSLSIWILGIIILSEIFFFIFKIDVLIYIIYSIGVIYASLTLFSYLFIIGPYKESTFARKYAYKFNRVFSKLLLLNFYKPASYIMWTQRTNQSTRQFIFGLFLLLPISFYTGLKTSKVISQLESKSYFEMNSLEYDVARGNYLDMNQSARIVKPIIHSKYIDNDYIELFIPEIKREEMFKMSICRDSINMSFKESKDNRSDRYKRKEDCALKYYSISIDEEKKDVTFEYVRHTLNNEKGFSSYISVKDLSKGKHILNIMTGYQNDKGEYAKRVIPFIKN